MVRATSLFVWLLIFFAPLIVVQRTLAARPFGPQGRPTLSSAADRSAVPGQITTDRISQESKSDGAVPPNVLLICIDDLRPELGCYGKSYIQSPAIDRLAQHSVLYRHHYVQAPTCGASRYALLTGRYGTANNGALFRRAERISKGQDVPPSLPQWFRQNGYETVSIGKVSHHPGGRGGPDWNDPQQPEMPNAWDLAHAPAGEWQHPRGWMHGLANGEIRRQAGQMAVFQHHDGPDAAYPDGLTVPLAQSELERLGRQNQPFLLAVGLLRPHLPFGAPARDFQRYESVDLPPIPHPEKPQPPSTWHRSGEFMKYQRWGRDPNNDAEFADQVRRHYAACVTFADRQVGRLLQSLRDQSLDSNTIVVIWGDHGWHLGEHAVWGKHTLFEESLRAPLIIHDPRQKESKSGAIMDEVVETVDVFPTLCHLSGLPLPEDLHGSILPGFSDGASTANRERSGFAVSYFGNRRTLRNDRYRLIVHDGGQIELYDHQTTQGETHNRSGEMPEVVRRLNELLEKRWAMTHQP